MKPALLVALAAIFLPSCTPGSTDRWSQASAIAFAMGEKFADVVADLPPEAFMGEHANTIERRWYDSDRTLNIQTDGEGGYYLDISSASSGESAVKNNANAFQFGAQGLSTLEQLGLRALMAQGGAGVLSGALPQAVEPDPLTQALDAFMLRTGRRPTAVELEMMYQALETLGYPMVSTAQPVTPSPAGPVVADPIVPGMVPGPGGMNQ